MTSEKFANEFIDRWCAKNIRKVKCCAECLHYQECLEKGASVCPSAIERVMKQKGKIIILDD